MNKQVLRILEIYIYIYIYTYIHTYIHTYIDISIKKYIIYFGLRA